MIWLAHALSLSRLPLAAAFWLVVGDPPAALAIVAVAALTDALDGRVARAARRRGEARADLGGWLDPLCDKVFAVAAVAALAVRAGVAPGLLALVAARDLLMAPLLAVYALPPLRRRYPVALRAAWPGKLTTVAQFVALLWLVAGSARPLVPALACAALGAVAVGHYLVLAWRSGRARPAATAASRYDGGPSARIP